MTGCLRLEKLALGVMTRRLSVGHQSSVIIIMKTQEKPQQHDASQIAARSTMAVIDALSIKYCATDSIVRGSGK
jgi:hypothetical protein